MLLLLEYGEIEWFPISKGLWQVFLIFLPNLFVDHTLQKSGLDSFEGEKLSIRYTGDTMTLNGERMQKQLQLNI